MTQALVDFVAEFSSHVDVETPLEWVISVYGTPNLKGSDVGIVLEGPNNILIK